MPYIVGAVTETFSKQSKDINRETDRLTDKLLYNSHSCMHHYESVAPNVDIILQSGRFWATSIASFRERFNDSRSCWVVFIHVVRGRPGGLLQFSKGEAVKICLASDSSGIRAMWPNMETACLNCSRKMRLLWWVNTNHFWRLDLSSKDSIKKL